MDNGACSYRRFLEGDNTGIVEIVREYKDGLILYLNSYVRDFSLAEELAEDTFVKLCIKRPKNRENAAFKTWLYTIGRNVALDWLRRNRTAAVTSLELTAEPAEEEHALEESYIKEEQKRALYHAMESLMPDHRQVLWLIYFEDLTCKEVALIMKKSVHSVEMMVHRARAALKAQLEKEGFVYENL